MMNEEPIRRPVKPSEEGYILLGVIILLAIFIIAMAVAAPRIAASIQRDRDVETMHRGKQYARAIQLYYRKFHAYPPSIDALVKTNEIRFLRKKYIDPTTGKDDWKPIAFGQNKTPMAMGFFGQPLGGAGGVMPIAGTGPAGGNGLTGGSFNGGVGNTNPSGSMFGNPTQPTTGSPTDPASGGSGAGGPATDANGTPIGGSGQTFGGAGIIGVSPASPKQSILVYKKKNHYNEWEFLYSPLSEMQMMGGGNTGGIGQPVGGPGTGVGPGTNGGFGPGGGGIGGPGGGGSTFGPGGNTGSTPMPPTAPTQPQ